MKILHDGAEASPQGINGVNATIWLLARRQRELGHDVAIVQRAQPTDLARNYAGANDIRLIWPTTLRRQIFGVNVARAFDGSPPDIVQMHSVFIPSQALLGRQLRRLGIPYVVTPHGGLAARILNRRRRRKALYIWLVERARIRGAAAVTASFGEEREIGAFLAGQSKQVRCLAIPVDGERLNAVQWRGRTFPRRLVFMGRYDVFVKGIDRVVAIAGLMRDHQFHLYGSEDPKTAAQLRQLRRWCLPNVFFHEPVFGDEKIQTLCNATMYIQMSRCESFGISIAEAMYLGVPCAVSDEINLAATIQLHELGLTLPDDPGRASRLITDALASPSTLERWSLRSRHFARTHFDANTVASNYVHLYEELLPPRSCGKRSVEASDEAPVQPPIPKRTASIH